MDIFGHTFAHPQWKQILTQSTIGHVVTPKNQEPRTAHLNAQPMASSSANKRKHAETLPVTRQVGSSDLERACMAIMEDLRWWIPEVPVEFKLDHILPPVICDYPVVKSKLKSSKCIHNDQWVTFLKNPTQSKLHENNVLRPLEQVFADIAIHARDSVTQFSPRMFPHRLLQIWLAKIMVGAAVWRQARAVTWRWVRVVGHSLVGRQTRAARKVWERRPARAMPQCLTSSITLIGSHIQPRRIPVNWMATLYEATPLLWLLVQPNQNSHNLVGTKFAYLPNIQRKIVLQAPKT